MLLGAQVEAIAAVAKGVRGARDVVAVGEGVRAAAGVDVGPVGVGAGAVPDVAWLDVAADVDYLFVVAHSLGGGAWWKVAGGLFLRLP